MSASFFWAHTDLNLLPFELNSDLNNNGQIDGTDSSLKTAGAPATATDDAKEKATEYLFANDQLSNGLWDTEDQDPNKPSTAKDDDDVQEIKTICAATWGAIWFDHPIINKLAFYRTKECKQTADDKMTFPFALSETNKLPEKLYIRAEDVTAQIEGELVMKFGKVDKTETWAEDKLRLTIVKELGNKNYFYAARDYILESNTRFFAHDRSYTSWKFRVVSMREEATTMYPIDTYNRPQPLAGIDAVIGTYPQISVIVNGNVCFFSSPPLVPTAGHMTDRCHGRMVRFGQVDWTVSSDDANKSPLAGTDAKYVGQFDSPKRFVFSTGRVPDAAPGLPDAAMGGLSTNYTDPDRIDREFQMIGFFPGKESGKGIAFTATQISGSGGGPELAADAERSEVPKLPGSDKPMVLLLDGGTSTAVAHANFADQLKVIVKGPKHSWEYKINTYLLFRCEPPR